MYEALGLCGEGFGGKLIDDAEWITNQSGTKLTSNNQSINQSYSTIN